MYDHQIRTELAREQAESLRRYWPTGEPKHRIREVLGTGLIRAGEKLVPKSAPRPRAQPSRMNPWRAALTSATASGKRTRIASRRAIACSSAPPVA
jgi:hypothetical protein